jgi:hypothetical protein
LRPIIYNTEQHFDMSTRGLEFTVAKNFTADFLERSTNWQVLFFRQRADLILDVVRSTSLAGIYIAISPQNPLCQSHTHRFGFGALMIEDAV